MNESDSAVDRPQRNSGPMPGNDSEYRAYTRLLFGAIRRTWSPLPDGQTEAYLKTCRDYLQATADLRDGKAAGIDGAAANKCEKLRRISQSLFPEAANLPAPRARIDHYQFAPADTDTYYAELHEVDYLLQVMEIAWLENNLDCYGAHPQNRGWMNVFRRWSSSAVFHRYWPVLRGQYSREFVRFCSAALNLPEPSVKWCRINDPSSELWNRTLEIFGIEFQREWAESMRDIDGITETRQFDYIKQAVLHSLGRGDRLAWVLTFGGGGERQGELTIADWCNGPRIEEQNPHSSWSPSHRSAYVPLGLVVAFRPWKVKAALAGIPEPEKAPREWELLVWIRGPYRSMGLGRACLPWLLDDPTCSRSKDLGDDHEIPFEGQTKKHGILHELPKEVTHLYVRYPQLASSAGDRLQRRIWTWFFNDNDFVSEYRDPRNPEQDAIKLVREIDKPAAKLTFQKPRGPGRRDASSPERPAPPTEK